MGANSSNTLESGLVSRQSLAFSSSSVNATASVFSLTGSDAGIPRGISFVGRLLVNETSTAGLDWDTNDAGRVFSARSSSGSVGLEPTTGRGMISLSGGFPNGLFDQAVFYLTGPGNGFLLDTSTPAHNRGLAGPMKFQASQNPFSAETISGSTIVGSIGPSVSTTAHVQESMDGTISKTVSGNDFAVSFVGDFNIAPGPAIANVATSRTETFAINADTGRGTVAFGTSTNVFYIIGPRQYVQIDQSPLPNSVAITFADPR